MSTPFGVCSTMARNISAAISLSFRVMARRLDHLLCVAHACSITRSRKINTASSTFELVRLIEDVGHDIAGICLDTANVLCHAEDPVAAARRAAPYTHLTHIKDAIIHPIPGGYRRQTLPIGRGALDWEAILPILADHELHLPLSIEDHKWLFDVAVLDPEWQALHPDLTQEELAKVMTIARQCELRIAAGGLRDPEEYEKVAFVDELEKRLADSRDYLVPLIRRLGLATERP